MPNAMNVQHHFATFVRRSSVRRGFWVLMGAAHAPALVKVWSALANEAGWTHVWPCVTLTLAVVFFALKVLDAPWLRLRPDPRGWLAMALVVAVLHVDVVRPQQDLTFIPECTTLAAATWLLAVNDSRRPRGAVTGNRSAPALAECTSSVLFTSHTLWLDRVRPHCWARNLHVFVLRAPPA